MAGTIRRQDLPGGFSCAEGIAELKATSLWRAWPLPSPPQAPLPAFPQAEPLAPIQHQGSSPGQGGARQTASNAEPSKRVSAPAHALTRTPHRPTAAGITCPAPEPWQGSTSLVGSAQQRPALPGQAVQVGQFAQVLQYGQPIGVVQMTCQGWAGPAHLLSIFMQQQHQSSRLPHCSQTQHCWNPITEAQRGLHPSTGHSSLRHEAGQKHGEVTRADAASAQRRAGSLAEVLHQADRGLPQDPHVAKRQKLEPRNVPTSAQASHWQSEDIELAGSDDSPASTRSAEHKSPSPEPCGTGVGTAVTCPESLGNSLKPGTLPTSLWPLKQICNKCCISGCRKGFITQRSSLKGRAPGLSNTAPASCRYLCNPPSV